MQPHRVKLAPSILAADFARLGEQVGEAEQAGADRIHVDVMDGHFVPNHTMGPAIVQSLRRVTHLPLETHLMISNPDFFLEAYIEAGSDSLLVHWEGNNNPPAGRGPGVGHDGRSGFRTPALHPHVVAKSPARPRDDRQDQAGL